MACSRTAGLKQNMHTEKAVDFNCQNDIELVRSQLLLNCHLLDGFSSKLDFSPQLRLLQRKYKVPVAYVSVLDRQKQYFLSSIGLPQNLSSIPRSSSYCCLAMLHDAPQVSVLHGDDIPSGFALFSNGMDPQFYAAASIFIGDIRVGTVAILDSAPLEGLSEQSFQFLKTVADTISEVLDERHKQYAIEPSYHITESMMLYVKSPLLQLTHLSIALQAALVSYGVTQGKRQFADLTSSLEAFKKGCGLLDEVIRNGLQLSLLLLDYMSVDKKKDYFDLLQSSKFEHRMTVSQELDKMFKSILSHTSISTGSYNDNVMPYYWSNGQHYESLQTRRNSLESSSRDTNVTFPSHHEIKRSLSRTMLGMLSSDSYDTRRGLTVMTGKEICLDRVLVWSTLYALLVCNQDSWDHVQLSVGVVHSESDAISTVLMKLTFLNGKSSEVSSTNEDETLQLLRATLRCIGGEVRRADFMSDVMCQYEVSMPGYIEDNQLSPRPPPLSCGSCDIKYSTKRQAVSSPSLLMERHMVIPKPLVDTVDESSRGSAKSSLKSSKVSHSSSKLASGAESRRSSQGAAERPYTGSSTRLQTESLDNDLVYYAEQELAMMLDNSITPQTAIPGSGQVSVASIYTSTLHLDELDQK
eukprot:gene39757-48404_t